LVFLTQKEVLDKFVNIKIKFDFGPGRIGPFSMEICDEVDFLKSVGMIKVDGKKHEITDKGVRFLGDEVDFLKSVGMIKVDGKKHEITDKGVRFLEKKKLVRVSEDVKKTHIRHQENTWLSQACLHNLS
jgi:predicted transcriptional regulator